VRVAEYPHVPSRRGTIFLFDDLQFAERARDTWFPGEQRHLLEARIIKGSRVHRADAKWLDSTREHWEENARWYWSGDMTADPRPEVLIDGAVYFPGWRDPPFGRLAGLLDLAKR
jgi:hypothetical protein